MSHPIENPTMKHDLVIGVWPIKSANDFQYFSSAEEISKAVVDVDSIAGKPCKVSTIYTYLEPHDPNICRLISVVGFVDKDFVGSSTSNYEKIFFGVKRADGNFYKQLDKRNVKNSNEFAKLMAFLFKKDFAAIVKLDKEGKRIGFLSTWENIEGEVGVGLRGSYAGVCQACSIDILKYLSCQPAQSEVKPFSSADDNVNLWRPPGESGAETNEVSCVFAPTTFDSSMKVSSSSLKRKRSPSFDRNDENFHKDEGAAAADEFYSNLTRDLDTRADSRLFHMRSFNGWVKATQIAEVKPSTKVMRERKGMRVLDLACGKGGDVGKFTLHSSGVSNYVGIDVARGSLRDAAKRVSALPSGKLRKASFVCADLGSEVPGSRKFSLETWTMNSATILQDVPRFHKVQGGGVASTDRFDLISIQFAIHYMMSSETRARRFFKTVGNLLDIGGCLIATTIDARIIVWHLMNLGLNLDEIDESETVTVSVGEGACSLKFEPAVVRRLFESEKNVESKTNESSVFGLQYSFTLSEGDDHASGVGKAVDLPEWLTPVPVIESIANEAGLRLDYHENFHEFYAARSDPQEHPIAHNALYNMKVLDRMGSISQQEWDISRLYTAIKFTKVTDSKMTPSDDEDGIDEVEKESCSPKLKMSMVEKLKLAKSRAAQLIGPEKWRQMSSEDKNRFMNEELVKLQQEQ